MFHKTRLLVVTLLAAAGIAAAANQPATANSGAFDRLIDRVVAREAENTKALRLYTPIVETYIQNVRSDKELGAVPDGDDYFLSRAKFAKNFGNTAFHPEPGLLSRVMHLGKDQNEFIAQGFISMSMIDSRGIDKQHYAFDYVGREFVGELRCIVLDVSPKPKSGPARFLGRIWVEDQGFNIVRFNGTFAPQPKHGDKYLRFDTWRLNMQPSVWLPAYIYSEESPSGNKHDGYKSQTRLWGYNVGRTRTQDEFAEVLVDSNDSVKDNSDKVQDLSPVASQRAWQRQAEDNVIERLERGGLLAKQGEVDKVLNTVINNLEITNNLDIQPEVRCRVLLTSPVESFSIGHTIVLSRGLLDVLPDEASLAAVLAHELSHIVLGHKTDTTFAFNDRIIVSDPQVFARLHFTRSADEETEADSKALQILQSSPYHDKLVSVGLFLRQVDARRASLPHLIKGEMGNSLSLGSKDLRMAKLMDGAPRLEPKQVTQIAALPLGGRIKVDPWTNSIEISKNKPVSLLTAREKMPFEVTPMYPHLTRISDADKGTDTKAPAPTADSQPTAGGNGGAN